MHRAMEGPLRALGLAPIATIFALPATLTTACGDWHDPAESSLDADRTAVEDATVLDDAGAVGTDGSFACGVPGAFDRPGRPYATSTSSSSSTPVPSPRRRGPTSS